MSGCVAAVTPFLNNIDQVNGWNVDTDSPEKILMVQVTDHRIGTLVIKAVGQAAYQADYKPRP
ncbi:copper chaperone [Larkinella humicola]|uniref:Copper chaperone n=1 Tax=Larkinella humicola TaxID=2607654 RepID=A0A5N1J3V0_9BACT|nr:copper chaperone [Larkinella humicola]KAA9341206.1 copper chaperone [Larkinella humicola]